MFWHIFMWSKFEANESARSGVSERKQKTLWTDLNHEFGLKIFQLSTCGCPLPFRGLPEREGLQQPDPGHIDLFLEPWSHPALWVTVISGDPPWNVAFEARSESSKASPVAGCWFHVSPKAIGFFHLQFLLIPRIPHRICMFPFILLYVFIICHHTWLMLKKMMLIHDHPLSLRVVFP